MKYYPQMLCNPDNNDDRAKSQPSKDSTPENPLADAEIGRGSESQQEKETSAADASRRNAAAGRHEGDELLELRGKNGPSLFELMQQAFSSTEGGYDLLAPKFNATPFRTPDFVLRKVAPVIASKGPVDAALDVCCGTGAGVEMLAPLTQKRLVGIDFSEGMLEQARKTVKNQSASPAVEFVQGDALALPFREEFDVAVSFGALGHILREDQQTFVDGIYRSLKPGGRFVFVTNEMPPVLSKEYILSKGFNAAMHVRNMMKSPPFHMYYLLFHLDEAKERLQQAGFEVQVHDAFEGKLSRLKVVEATKK